MSLFRDLQHDMNSLFGELFSVPILDPYEGLDELRERMCSMIDEEYPRLQQRHRQIPSAAPSTARGDSDAPAATPAAPADASATSPATAVTTAAQQPEHRILPRRRRNTEALWIPRCDVEETPSEVIVRAECPGVTKDEIKLEADPARALLTISGQRKRRREEGSAGSTYHCVETSEGSFRRVFRLPDGCKAKLGEISARHVDGVLEVHCPKAPAPEEPKAMNITIQ
ncbi:putative HSP20 family protein [Paratrimastix pyriformis]|uniref:HSP20 family protein n=1 Tax=Paratrimastix pyriformis TaxID=342808 RepID=A0ABQ8URE7_9EUKA|nr:putative HSP20 family protein [Paratrimastix pyriformis]